MSDAREAILGKIRAANVDLPKIPLAPATRPEVRPIESRSRAEIVALFAERLADYGVPVTRCANAELPSAIAQAVMASHLTSLAVAPGIPDGWLPAGLEIRRDPELSDSALDNTDGVLTGCAVAIAETGTIVLNGGARQGRRVLTLLPDYHLCVVEAGQILGRVPDAIAFLEAGLLERRTPLTFISGPSATADIELKRVVGVHGPRTLAVIIVGLAD